MVQKLVFLSHADKDKKIAEKIAQKLEKDFSIFVAHRDIETGAEWENVLKTKIVKCDLFVILLSSNFRNANYTDQEVGIAISHEKKVCPISMDGTKPYGFMSKYQGEQITLEENDDEMIKLSQLFRRLIDGKNKPIDGIILNLKYSGNFDESKEIINELEYHYEFTEQQIIDIMKIYLDNSQVRDCWSAKKFICPLVEKNRKRIEEKHGELLKQCDIFCREK